MGSTKRQVQTAFFDAGLTLEREALNTFVAFVEENGGEEELIYSLLDSSVQGTCLIPYFVPYQGVIPSRPHVTIPQ